MTDKTFCDVCGKEIDGRYDVGVYDDVKQEAAISFDLCPEDAKRAIAAIRGLIKK
jgi:hypothetical protein